MQDPEPAGSLECPHCGLAHALSERFCRACGMPLVHAGRGDREPSSEAHARARKLRPQYGRGELIRVTGARNQAEAELIQGILLEQGVPSIVRRTRGFDVPDFLAAGPRDLLVPESGYERARTLLRDADLLSAEASPGSMPGIGSPARLAAALLVAVVLAALVVWLLYQATA
jgi:hypothetical protein